MTLVAHYVARIESVKGIRSNSNPRLELGNGCIGAEVDGGQRKLPMTKIYSRVAPGL